MPVFRYISLKCALTAALLLCGVCLAQAQSKGTVGWLEKARIFPSDILVHAKLDTGADYSSLNASNLREFDRDGKKWVSFEVTNRFDQKATVEEPVVRVAMVKKHFGKPARRLVVRLGICVANHYMEADVNLVDRSNFENQMLLGRSFLAGNLVIDPALTFTAEPACNKPKS